MHPSRIKTPACLKQLNLNFFLYLTMTLSSGSSGKRGQHRSCGQEALRVPPAIPRKEQRVRPSLWRVHQNITSEYHPTPRIKNVTAVFVGQVLNTVLLLAGNPNEKDGDRGFQWNYQNIRGAMPNTRALQQGVYWEIQERRQWKRDSEVRADHTLLCISW